MKAIEMTTDEASFISEVLALFRKLSSEQQLEVTEQIDLTMRISKGLC
jgi:hypothetical protein